MRLNFPRTWFRRARTPGTASLEALFDATFENADVGIAHVGLDGRMLRANANLRALLGYSAQEIAGVEKFALVHADCRAAVAADFDALRRGAASNYAAERTYLAKSGAPVIAWTAARLIGDPPVVLVVIENVSARRAAEAALRESEERFELAMRGANEGLYDWRIKENNSYLSPRWKSMLGYEEHEIANEPNSWWELTAPGVAHAVAEQIRRLEAREIDNYEMELKLRHKDGRWLDILSRGFPVFDGDHRVVRLVGTHQDITLRKRHEAELRLSSTVFANTPEGILIADFAGRIKTVNPAFEALTGYRSEEICGRRANVLKSGRHDAKFYQLLYSDIRATGRWRGEIWNRRKDGSVQAYWTTISVVRDDSGEPAGYVAVYSDIGDFKRSQARLDFLVHHDPDTALPNRLSLRGRIEAAMIEIEQRGVSAALLHLELDRFRTIVESLGDLAGDELLAQAGQRFLAKLGARDMLARIGADEFAILRHGCASEQEARRLADELVAAIEQPFVFASGAKAYSGVNVGVVFIASSEGGADMLMRQAESALYVAKGGGGGVRLYEPRHMLEARQRLEMETGLRRGLEHDEFVLQFQPLVDLADRRAFGVEALVRWRTPEGLAPPGRFIPLAEQTGLIIDVGRYVLDRATRDAARWRRQNPDALPQGLFVNVSPRELAQPNYTTLVAQTLAKHGLKNTDLALELTERVFINEDDSTIISTLNALSAMGIRLILDDFGTGYSALSSLKRFPFAALKIDRSFIQAITTPDSDAPITKAVIGLGVSLGLAVIAEGIETDTQLNYLRNLHCDAAQGFKLARPQTTQDITKLLKPPRHNTASPAGRKHRSPARP